MQLKGQQRRRRFIGCFGVSSMKLQVDHEIESIAGTEGAWTETKSVRPHHRHSKENSTDSPKKQKAHSNVPSKNNMKLSELMVAASSVENCYERLSPEIILQKYVLHKGGHEFHDSQWAIEESSRVHATPTTKRHPSTINLEDYMLPPLQQNTYKSAPIAPDASISTETTSNMVRSLKTTLNVERRSHSIDVSLDHCHSLDERFRTVRSQVPTEIRNILERNTEHRSMDSVTVRSDTPNFADYNSWSSLVDQSFPTKANASAVNYRKRPNRNSMAKGLRSFGKRLRSIFN